jgi:small subunit ribosomal protein S2
MRKAVEVIKNTVEVLIMTTEHEFMVSQDQYLKSGIHIGTKFKTRYMSPFIYKTRTDGLSVLNLQKIDERIRLAANLIAQYEPKDILVACRRENGWKAVKAFGRATGATVFPGRYPPGILTNPKLTRFMEVKLIFVADPWPDKNVVNDAMTLGIPVIALCDTNNQSNDLDLVVPCNNKGKKSLGLLFYILAREYVKKKGLISGEPKFTVEDFTEE